MSEHKRILVVDDEPQITRVLRTSLSRHGYDIRVANDGETALEIMKDWSPDMVITDLAMPNMDGLELCRRDVPGKRASQILSASDGSGGSARAQSALRDQSGNLPVQSAPTPTLLCAPGEDSRDPNGFGYFCYLAFDFGLVACDLRLLRLHFLNQSKQLLLVAAGRRLRGSGDAQQHKNNNCAKTGNSFHLETA